jgi:hypothetical protein
MKRWYCRKGKKIRTRQNAQYYEEQTTNWALRIKAIINRLRPSCKILHHTNIVPDKYVHPPRTRPNEFINR